MPSHLRPLLLVRLALCFVSAIAACPAQTGTVPALTTPLLLPSGLTYDPTGSLLFAERASHRVRRLTTAGTLTTVAGSGTQGFSGDGGPAAQAAFDSPEAVVSDAQGNLFVADTGNHRVRRIDAASGIVTTVAGTGAPASSGDDGPAGSAALDHPSALTINPAGNLYIADSTGQRVRRVDAHTAIITTVVGTGIEGFSGDGGPATTAVLDEPSGLAIDDAGDLLIADTRNHRIRLVSSASGQIQTIAGGPPGPLRAPRALALDRTGGILIADSGSNRVLRLDPQTGSLTPLAGSGSQAFSGDGAAAVSATLDSPGGLAIAPDGSVAIADTANGRIRLLTTSASGPALIQTIAGLGSARPTGLALSGATVTPYGSGTLAAAITAGSAVQGTVTLLDLSGSAPSPVATAPLSGGFASLPTSALSAGIHRLLATYGGDATHLPATSSPWTLTVTPSPVTASPAPASMLFGQAVPPLSGTLSGVLPRDVAGVQALFTAAASASSSPGAYPISATLAGTSSANYTLAVTSAVLTISKAPSLTVLSNLFGTLTAQVTSSTSGAPTGTLAINENGAALAGGVLTPTGAWTFSTSALAAGAHTLTALYGGDANFSPSQSSALAITVIGASPEPSPDFTLSAKTAGAVPVSSGSATAISFAITTTHGSLAGPIALSVTGLPALATAAFDPPSIPPGGAVSTFTLTVTPPLSARTRPPFPLTAPLLCLVLLPLSRLRRRSSPRITLACCAILAALLPLTGCGNRVYQGTSAASPAPTLYTIIVTGTATAADGTLLMHSATVQLSVTP